MRDLLFVLSVVCAVAQPMSAQEPGFADDLRTGVDEIQITPLDEGDQAGFDTGLSLEALQSFSNEGFQRELSDITTEVQETVVSAAGASVRVLDKLTGRVEDLDIAIGQSERFGRMAVFLGDCRYPEGNPSGDAYAYVLVKVDGMEEAAFSGWMVASSPALNAMDHQRYDLWPLACKTS